MLKLTQITILTGLVGLLQSCASETVVKPPQPETTTTPMENQGVICAYASSDTELAVHHYPLGTGCASSSRNKWKDSALDISFKPSAGAKDVLTVQTKATHIKVHSDIATADCAGAGKQSKKVTITPRRSIDIVWGDRLMGGIASLKGAVFCQRIDANGKVSPAPEFIRPMIR